MIDLKFELQSNALPTELLPQVDVCEPGIAVYTHAAILLIPSTQYAKLCSSISAINQGLWTQESQRSRTIGYDACCPSFKGVPVSFMAHRRMATKIRCIATNIRTRKPNVTSAQAYPEGRQRPLPTPHQNDHYMRDSLKLRDQHPLRCVTYHHRSHPQAQPAPA